MKNLKQYILFHIKTSYQGSVDQIARDFPLFMKELIKRWRDWILGPVYRTWIVTPPSPLLVICHGRTGSNFLLWMLESHPHIAQISEPFGTNELVHPWVVSRIREFGPLEYLKHGLRRKSNERVKAFKFLYLQFETDFAKQWGIPDLEDIRKYLSNTLDMKVIHLKRRNKLESLISLRLAQITKKYILTNPQKRVNDIQIELTPDECFSEFEKVTAFEEYYSALFAGHPLLEVYYEDLCINPQAEGKRVLEFLELKEFPLQERTVKQNIRPMREVLKNYDELKEYFSGTVWENLFSE